MLAWISVSPGRVALMESISTQKLHARGPRGLEALVSYKYVLYGDGQVR